MKRYAIAFLLCLVAVILVWLYVTKIDQASHIEKKYIDKVRLHSITIAIDLYVAKNDSLPQDEKVRITSGRRVY